MGYCYEITGGTRKLCCDNCHASGGVRKVACKHGVCQAVALCAGCRKNTTVRTRISEGCEAHCKGAAAYFKEQADKIAALHKRGAYTFGSAIGVGDDKVEVTFFDAARDSKKLTVAHKVYATLTRTTTYDQVAEAVTA